MCGPEIKFSIRIGWRRPTSSSRARNWWRNTRFKTRDICRAVRRAIANRKFDGKSELKNEFRPYSEIAERAGSRRGAGQARAGRRQTFLAEPRAAGGNQGIPPISGE